MSDRSKREAFVAKVTADGYAAAYAAFPDVNRNTGRSWVRSAKASPSPTEPTVSPNGKGSAELQREAGQAKTDERRSLRSAEQAEAKGDARAARELSAVARDHRGRWRELTAEARAVREHEQRIALGQAQLSAGGVTAYVRIVRLFIESLGLGWGRAHDAFADALLHAFTHGERLDNGNWNVLIPQHELAAVRQAIDRQLVREYDEPEPEKPTDAAQIEAMVEGEQAHAAEAHPHGFVDGASQKSRAGAADSLVDVEPPDPEPPAPPEPGEDALQGPPVEGFLQPIPPRRSPPRERPPSFRHPLLDQ
jgi:hypothetical protein